MLIKTKNREKLEFLVSPTTIETRHGELTNRKQTQPLIAGTGLIDVAI
jgi:hypothetical protein